MKRKSIGIVVTGYDQEYETKIIAGIIDECKKRDINALIFATLIRKPPVNQVKQLSENIVRGETEIFNLINYKKLDGILILGDNLVDTEWIFRINERAKAENIPVINLNDKLRELDYNILADNRDAMGVVVRHLIKDHGLTKINFIGGFKGNIQTEERLAAYKKVLAENNIPFEEDRVAYGEFWTKAKECTEEFLNRDELPQAIVCASDTMAMFAMDAIKERGLSIPEDIVVTGFDGISDCDKLSPTLTSVRPAYGNIGAEAVKTLEKIWAGEKVDRILKVESELIKHQSCGCQPKSDSSTSIFREETEKYNTVKSFNAMLTETNAYSLQATSSEELYKAVTDGAYLFRFSKMFVCICENVEKVELAIENEENGNNQFGLTDRCLSMYSLHGEVPVGYEFNIDNMLPYDWESDDEPLVICFSSMYFNNKCLGYIAYTPEEIFSQVGSLFQTWVLQMANHAGSLYARKQLEAIAVRLEVLHSTDPLTGLYNRRGREKNEFVIEKAKERGAYLTVMVSDVDNLKKVNDKFGHEGGDIVITQVADAILKATPENAVCQRVGGDEFVAFFDHDEEIDVKKIVTKINDHLFMFNSKSGLPYKASCSIGYVTAKMDPSVSFDELAKKADDNMYEVKMMKKTRIYDLDMTEHDGEASKEEKTGNADIDRCTKEQLYDLAFFERVTHYYNWSWMREKLSNFEEYGIKDFVFVHFDIKDFKMVNEIYGHTAGDNLLRKICMVMQSCDWAYYSCRCDNDNFAMMIKTADHDVIQARLEDMFAKMGKLDEDDQYPLFFRCGVAAIDNVEDYHVLVTDMAKLAQSLGTKANVTEIYFYTEEMKNEQIKGKIIKNDLPRAIEDGELLVYYQPKYNPLTNTITGAEALIRWNKCHKQLLPPGQFVPYLEKEGVVDVVDRYVLEEVCKKLEQWKREGVKLVPISVNMSKVHFYNPLVIQNILNIVDRYDVDRKYIEFELTESLAYDDEVYMLNIMRKLRALGFKLSIDDFGTGYSSLKLLSNMPLTILKIDKSFVDEIENETSEKVRVVIKDIIQMTKDLKVMSLAEGVETEAQKDLLREWGVDYIQGYYYSKPLPVEEFELRLERD